MHSLTRIPASLSVYEALRMRPAASARLAQMGITRDMYDYRITEAASALGLPTERLTDALAQAAPAFKERTLRG